MPTIAELQVNVDSRPITTATNALNSFADAANRASQASKANSQSNSEASGSASKAAQAEQNLSAIIDAQTRKLEQLAEQRRKLDSGNMRSTMPAEYERLNRIIDANIALVNRQGNAIDTLNARQERDVARRQQVAAMEVRAQERLVAATERRENVITRAAAREQRALEQTINGLSRQIKAQNEYNATIAQLERARAPSNGSNPALGQGEYESLVKLAQARRDASLATVDQSREIEAAKNKLDTFTATLGKAERAEVQYARAVKTLDDNLKLGNLTQDQYNNKLAEFTRHRDASVRAANDNAAAEARFSRELRSVLTAYDPVLRAQDQYNNSVGILSQGLQNGSVSVQQFNRALTAQREALDNVKAAQSGRVNNGEEYERALNALVPYRAELRNLEAAERALKAQKDAGKITTQSQISDYDKATQAIQRQRTELQRRIRDGNESVLTYKQEAAALRGVPAQITDIVVSLQGGQAPLTVLLQQGGQLRDMFGGVIPAFKALASKAIEFITPLTAAIGVFGTLAVAANGGADEIIAFNKATALTANTAGVSSLAFIQYQNTLDGVAGTATKAAEALTLIQSGGKVTAESFVAVAQAAIQLERATGQALSKTIDDFNSLGKDPVDAAVRLDEKYKFLTASILSQAQALVTAGREIEATELLQNSLAEATTATAKRVIDQAGLMERAWVSVKDAVSETWDTLRSIGRADNSANQLKAQQELLERTVTRLREGNLIGKGLSDEEIENNQVVRSIKERIASYQALVDKSNESAKAEREAERVRTEAVLAQNQAQRRYENSLKGVEKAEADLVKVRRENDRIRAGGNLTPEQNALIARNEKAALEALSEAKDKEAKKNRPKTSALDTTDVQEVRSNLKVIEAEYEGYYKRVTALGEANLVSDEATYASQKAILQAQRAAVSSSFDAQINAIKELQANKKNSVAQNISLDNQLTKAEADRLIALEKIDAKQDALAAKEDGRIQRRTQNVAAYRAALDNQLQNLQDDGARNVEGVGRGDRAGGVARQLADNDRTFNRQQRQLTSALANGLDPEEYAAKLKDLKEVHTQLAEQIIKNDKDIDEANSSYFNGFNRALENAEAVGRDFATTADQMLSGAFNNASDALTQFVTTGKINFADFTRSILADLAQIAAKQAASAALSGLFRIGLTAASAYYGGGAGGFAAGSAGATSSALGASQAGYTSAYGFKNGGGFDGGIQRFAKGGDFTNSIVSTPTRFRFGDQLGEMGEAGPEAILPLQRAANGALGVRAVGNAGLYGGSGAGNTPVQVNVYVTSEGTTSDTSGGQAFQQFGSEIGAFVDQRIYSVINKESRSGGSLSGAAS